MARTIEVAGPADITSPNLLIITTGDTIADTVTLTQSTNAKGRYIGALTVAAADYTCVLRSGATVIGTFLQVPISGIDPEAVVVSDRANPQYVQKLGQNVTRTHRTSGDTLPEVVTDG